MRRARSCRAHRQRQLVDVAHTRSRRYRVNSLPRDAATGSLGLWAGLATQSDRKHLQQGDLHNAVQNLAGRVIRKGVAEAAPGLTQSSALPRALGHRSR